MNSDQYEALLDTVPGIVYRCRPDSDWTILYISAGIEELTGYPASDFLLNHKRNFDSIVEPADRDNIRRVIRKALKKKRPYSLEYRIVRSDGAVHWVYERGRGEYDDNGDPFQLIGCIQDISTLHASQEALETEKELFRMAIENIPGVVFRAAVWDQWGIELLSDQAAVLLGVDPDARVGTDLRDFYREIVHPEDFEILLQMVEGAVESGMPYELKYRVIWPDGSTHWVMEKGQAQISESNQQKYLSGVILDISRSRTINQELKDLRQRLLD